MKVSDIKVGMRIWLPLYVTNTNEHWHHIYHIDNAFLYSLSAINNPISKEALKNHDITIGRFEYLKTIQVLHEDRLYAVNTNLSNDLSSVVDTTNHTYVRQRDNKELVQLLHKVALAKYNLGLI